MKFMYKVEEEYSECFFLDRYLTGSKERAIKFAESFETDKRVIVKRMPIDVPMEEGGEIVWQKQAAGYNAHETEEAKPRKRRKVKQVVAVE